MKRCWEELVRKHFAAVVLRRSFAKSIAPCLRLQYAHLLDIESAARRLNSTQGTSKIDVTTQMKRCWEGLVRKNFAAVVLGRSFDKSITPRLRL